MRFPTASLNQRFPSGPGVIALGDEPAVIPVLNSVTTPAVVTRPTRLPLAPVNQRLPSGPAAMSVGAEAAVVTNSVTVNSVTTPAGEIRAI